MSVHTHSLKDDLDSAGNFTVVIKLTEIVQISIHVGVGSIATDFRLKSFCSPS